MTRKMPPQKPGKSSQDYRTPPNFLAAVRARYGNIDFDLAATAENAVVPFTSSFFTPEQDALIIDWRVGSRLAWLNPPFGAMPKWSEKCAEESRKLTERGRILMLCPASVGSNWFYDHVYQIAEVLFLKGRLAFVGETAPYPKDCMLVVYKQEVDTARLFRVWDWNREVR